MNGSPAFVPFVLRDAKTPEEAGERIARAIDGRSHIWRMRQLTTGRGQPTVQCTCPYTGTTWHEAHMVTEYHQEQDPDCPLHWAPSRMAPCTCSYAWRTRSGYIAPGVPRWIEAVKIQADCPHHATPEVIRRARVLRNDYSEPGTELWF